LDSKKIQDFPQLDDLDRSILGLLAQNGRMSNAELAEQVGLAQSTCLGRVRALISVTLRAGARANLSEFMAQMRNHPQVIQIFFLGGTEDFIVHVAVRNSDEVREFVLEQLSNNASVANTRTNIVFDHFHKGPLG
jgi:DNA-binding Lrp family transcriptional regulator